MCFRKTQIPYQTPLPLPVRPDNEADLLRRAFGLIQRRITEQLAETYPEARWIWETPRSQSNIAAGEPVHIILNRAGGYRRAEVQIAQLQFKGLKFDSLPEPVPPPAEDPAEEPGDTDYSLLAFEWVETHLLELNERGNELVVTGEHEIYIAADELPDTASWQAICDELKRNGFCEAVVTKIGITTKIPQ